MVGGQKIRLQFDVSEKTLAVIDELKRKSGAATRAEMFKKAISLYAMVMQEEKEGGRLVLKKGDKTVTVLIL